MAVQRLDDFEDFPPFFHTKFNCPSIESGFEAEEALCMDKFVEIVIYVKVMTK